ARPGHIGTGRQSKVALEAQRRTVRDVEIARRRTAPAARELDQTGHDVDSAGVVEGNVDVEVARAGVARQGAAVGKKAGRPAEVEESHRGADIVRGLGQKSPGVVEARSIAG